MATTGITVTGTGRAGGAPDLAYAELVAEVVADGVNEAVERASRAVASMRAALVEEGLGEDDLHTSGVSVHVDHSRRGGPRRYVARLGLTARLLDIDASGSKIQTALRYGGDAARLDGLTLTHADPAALRAAARDAAYADARARAEQLARLAGQSLGVVEEIVEGAGRDARPLAPVGFESAADAPVGLRVDAGQQDVWASVTVRWAWA